MNDYWGLYSLKGGWVEDKDKPVILNELESTLKSIWGILIRICLTTDHEVAGAIPGTAKNF